jgi:fumarylacetoacetate (FAA) hydrolase
MKLATLKGGRDGRLVVVSNDLRQAAEAVGIAGTMQAALDEWDATEPLLASLAASINAGDAATFPFRPEDCAAILPRAYQWVDASAYLSHVELVRKARGAEMPQNLYNDPLMYQGASDTLIGPRDDIALADEAWGIDMEAEVFVIVDDSETSSRRSSARGSGSCRASRRRLFRRLWQRRMRSAAPGTAQR